MNELETGAMTIAELIFELQQFPPHAEVYVQHDDGTLDEPGFEHHGTGDEGKPETFVVLASHLLTGEAISGQTTRFFIERPPHA